MYRSDETCTTSGLYSSFGPCCHPIERVIAEGNTFPRCPVCGQIVAWTLMRETDDWGEYGWQDEQPTSQFRGMTTNERLRDAGLLDEFDVAASRGDRASLIEILQRVGVSRPATERIVASILRKQ